jgi:hypothetical protein
MDIINAGRKDTSRAKYLVNNFQTFLWSWLLFPAEFKEDSSVPEERGGADMGEISTCDTRLDDEAVGL